MTTKSVPVRIPENLLELVDLCSREQRTDRSVTVRQWLFKAAEAYAVRLVSEGRMSAGRAAELLDLTYDDLYRIAQAQGIELGSTEDQYQLSRNHAPTARKSAGAELVVVGYLVLRLMRSCCCLLALRGCCFGVNFVNFGFVF